jgi:hypothetical protein
VSRRKAVVLPVAQARLPGTLPAPPVARANFTRAHTMWRGAAKDLEKANEAATRARDAWKVALAGEAAQSDDYGQAREGADAVVLKAVLEAAAAVDDLAEAAKDAAEVRRQARKAEREAWQRRRGCLGDLRAVQRGER